MYATHALIRAQAELIAHSCLFYTSSSYDKILGKQIFSLGSFPEVGQKQKTKKKKEEREKDWTMVITMAKLRMANASTHGARKPPGPKEERLNDGNNNGQATHGARKHAWRTQAAWAKKKDWTMVITMPKLCMVHASMQCAHKLPGPKCRWLKCSPFCVEHRSI